MAERMGYVVEWVGPWPIPRIYETLKTKADLDGAVNLPKSPAIESFLYYPEKPIYYGQPILAFRADSPITKVQSIEDI